MNEFLIVSIAYSIHVIAWASYFKYRRKKRMNKLIELCEAGVWDKRKSFSTLEDIEESRTGIEGAFIFVPLIGFIDLVIGLSDFGSMAQLEEDYAHLKKKESRSKLRIENALLEGEARKRVDQRIEEILKQEGIK